MVLTLIQPIKNEKCDTLKNIFLWLFSMSKKNLYSILFDAVNAEDVNAVAEFLQTNKFSHRIGNQALAVAGAKGNTELTTLLLPYANFNLANGYLVLTETLKNNHCDIIKSFVPILNRDCQITALRLALEQGVDTDLVDLLLTHLGEDVTRIDMLLSWAVQGKNINNIHRCLPFFNHNNRSVSFLLSKAAESGKVEIIEFFLNTFQSLQDDNNVALQTAASNGHTDCVKLLLSLPQADPSVRDYAPFREASKNGHIDTVQLLLPVSDVSKSRALVWAASYGRIDIVKQLSLLETSNSNKNDALLSASQRGHVDIVTLLLTEASSGNTWLLNCDKALQQAALYGHTDIVQLLLACHPTQDARNQALAEAASYGQILVLFVIPFAV